MRVENYNPKIAEGGCVVRSISKSLNKNCDILIKELKLIGNIADESTFEHYLLNHNFNIIDNYKDKFLKDISLDGNNIVFAHKDNWYHMISVIDNVIYDKNSMSDLEDLKIIKVYKK